MQNIWRASVGKIGKYIFFERLCKNVHSLLPAAAVFFLVKTDKSELLSSYESPFSASCLDSGFSMWGHRQEGKVVNSPHTELIRPSFTSIQVT